VTLFLDQVVPLLRAIATGAGTRKMSDEDKKMIDQVEKNVADRKL
jgi:hypothetical protein